jgi:hypothetical protein
MMPTSELTPDQQFNVLELISLALVESEERQH